MGEEYKNLEAELEKDEEKLQKNWSSKLSVKHPHSHVEEMCKLIRTRCGHAIGYRITLSTLIWSIAY